MFCWRSAGNAHTDIHVRASLCVLVQASARRENLSGTGQRSFERTTASTNTVGNVSKEAPGIFTWCVGVMPLRAGESLWVWGRCLLIDLFCVESEDGVFVRSPGFMRTCEGDWCTVSDPETVSIKPLSNKKKCALTSRVTRIVIFHNGERKRPVMHLEPGNAWVCVYV